MIIAVEGNVDVGKTTFCLDFLNENNTFQFIPESIFNEKLGPFERQIDYINQEKHKKKNMSIEDVILDRSIFSVFVYTIYTKNLYYYEKKEIVNIIKNCIILKQIPLPDKVYFIECPLKEIRKVHTNLKILKKTQNELIQDDFYNFYNNFFINTSNLLLVKKMGNRLLYQIEGKELLEKILNWEMD